MRYKRTISLSLFLLVLVSSLHAERPNILLILSDDHSVPHVGAYGDSNCQAFNLTPNLDAFAKEGMRFDRAYTTAPQCAPSRISIFTGRTPVSTSTTRFSQPAEPNIPLITDLLRKSGYWVGLDGRNQHLVGRVNDSPIVQETLVEKGMRGPAFESRLDHFVLGAKTKGEELAKVPGLVSSILDKVPEGKPFFLYFGFNQPHRGWGNDHDGIDPAKLKLPPDWPDLPEVRLDYACFLADVRDLDTGFGSVMQVLEERGLVDNTIVIFMGDNGEALLRGKGTLFDRGLHVPLIIRWPGKIEKGSESDALISGIDLAPTILHAAGVESDPKMSGVDFLPELLGESINERRYIFGERGWHAGPITRTDGFDLSRSVTSERYHFIYNVLPERSYYPVDMVKRNIAWEAIKQARSEGKLSKLHERLYFQNPRPIFELYDLENDPFQLNNLAGMGQVKEIEQELRNQLNRWMVSEGDFLPLPVHAQDNMEN